VIFAGCDVGSLSAEAALISDGSLLSYHIIKSRPKPENSANEVMSSALKAAGISWKDISFCISTGYGRENISFADDHVSEISCHGKGAQWLIPSVRTVIDVGGQDCKAIRVDGNGRLVNFVMNDKCAAGTGRFLEGMGKTLGLGLEELALLALRAENPLPITSICSVFTEIEALCMVNDGEELADIAAGVNQAMARRIKSLVARIGIEEDVCFTGGVAKNAGVVKSMEEMLGIEVVQMPEDPQVIGALGAALFAEEKGN